MFKETIALANACGKISDLCRELVQAKDTHMKKLVELCEMYPEAIPTEHIKLLLGLDDVNESETDKRKTFYVVEWVEYTDRYGGGTYHSIFDGEGKVKLFHKSMDIVDYVEYLRLQPQHFHKKLYVYDSEHNMVMKVSTFKKSLKKDEK